MAPDEPSFGPLQLTEADLNEIAIDALVERGIVERALLHGATAEAEELLAKFEDEPPPAA
jgi:hypothetical protein